MSIKSLCRTTTRLPLPLMWSQTNHPLSWSLPATNVNKPPKRNWLRLHSSPRTHITIPLFSAPKWVRSINHTPLFPWLRLDWPIISSLDHALLGWYFPQVLEWVFLLVKLEELRFQTSGRWDVLFSSALFNMWFHLGYIIYLSPYLLYVIICWVLTAQK